MKRIDKIREIIKHKKDFAKFIANFSEDVIYEDICEYCKRKHGGKAPCDTTDECDMPFSADGVEEAMFWLNMDVPNDAPEEEEI